MGSVTGFTVEQKEIVLFRDFGTCPMCYKKAGQVNHRANRGSGGYLGANTLANACAICWTCNGLIEHDPEYAELARFRGVKLSRYDDAETEPYFHPGFRLWALLENGRGDYTFTRPPARAIVENDGTPRGLTTYGGHLAAPPLPRKGEALMSSVPEYLPVPPSAERGTRP